MVGGDMLGMLVTQVAALMRVVGSHNSKRDEWKDVVVVDNTGHRYELDDLEEEMLFITSPIVLRKQRPPPTAGEINPFLDAAKSLGFKLPIDVEKRLAGMLYMGHGDASIHKTQIEVSASLLGRGVEIEEIVKLLLDATRSASGHYGARWNWRREENEIRKACATWLVKHPPDEKKIAAPKPVLISATVHKLDDARPKEAKPKSQKVIDRENMHILVGQTVLKVLADKGTSVMIVGDQLWRYADGMWTAPDNHGRNYLDLQIETCIRALGTVTSAVKLVSEVRAWIFFRNPDINHGTVQWDDHGKIAVRGGLIDPVTFEFVTANPSQHVTARIDCEYLADAKCPTWLTMLEATFFDRTDDIRADTIGLIQEIFGAALIEKKSKALSRALIFHGASNTGKTDLIKAIWPTNRSAISTPFAALVGTHGLMEFARKAPWVLHEAFEAGKWHFTSQVKSILSGDPVQINIKNGALVTQRIRQPIIWGTNFPPPQFKEATRAMINGMIVIDTYVVFDPKNPVGVAVTGRAAGYSEPSELILATEKPGLLNWALAGLRRALHRGYFKTTKRWTPRWRRSGPIPTSWSGSSRSVPSTIQVL
jgi:hypothetical protein